MTATSTFLEANTLSCDGLFFWYISGLDIVVFYLGIYINIHGLEDNFYIFIFGFVTLLE